MAAGSKRDGVPKGGGFATPDLETAAIFVGNEAGRVCSQREMCVPVQLNGSLLRLAKVNGSPVRSRVFENDVNYVQRKLQPSLRHHDHQTS